MLTKVRLFRAMKLYFIFPNFLKSFYFLKGSHKKESRKFSGIHVTTLRPSCLTRATTSYLWKRKKHHFLRKKIYLRREKVDQVHGKNKHYSFRTREKKTVVKIEMLAIFICNLIMQLTFWEKVLELFRRGKYV